MSKAVASACLLIVMKVKSPWLAGAALCAHHIHHSHALIALQHPNSHRHRYAVLCLLIWQRLLWLGHWELHPRGVSLLGIRGFQKMLVP